MQDPNMVPEALAELLSETAFKAIVVMPGYRVNAFGFLAGKELEDEARANGETYSNFGFWDQRTALEWTHDRIASFGGNKENITVAGYSAGSYSTFQQLAYDVYLPQRSSIIKRGMVAYTPYVWIVLIILQSACSRMAQVYSLVRRKVARNNSMSFLVGSTFLSRSAQQRSYLDCVKFRLVSWSLFRAT
jgi:carboxylesterase type B